MYYLRTRSAVDPLKGLGINTSKAQPKPEQNEQNVEHVEVPTISSNSLISENKELEMVSQPTIRPDDSPFECEGCGS